MNVTERIRRHAGGLFDFVFPNPCLSCHQAMGPAHAFPGLCQPCSLLLQRAHQPACAGCGMALHAADLPESYQCGQCRALRPAYERLLIAWSYEPPLDAVLRALKFRRLEYLGSLLAAELLPCIGDEFGNIDTVVPVPLHWLRHLRRGYNQAELIARPLAGLLGLPLTRGLRRIRGTAPQTQLARGKRRDNLQQVFRVRNPEALRDQRLLLVDDVFTTGATLRSAAATLKQAGARSVDALAVARTPKPKEKVGQPPTSAQPRGPR